MKIPNKNEFKPKINKNSLRLLSKGNASKSRSNSSSRAESLILKGKEYDIKKEK